MKQSEATEPILHWVLKITIDTVQETKTERDIEKEEGYPGYV